MITLEALHKAVITAKRDLRRQVREEYHQKPVIHEISLAAYSAEQITLTIYYKVGNWTTGEIFNVAL